MATNKLIEYIKEDEFVKIMKAEKKRDFKLAYLLAYGSGLRISEIIGYQSNFTLRKNKETGVVEKINNPREIKPLVAEQIDLQSKMIKVVGGKGQKDRIVPLFPGFKEEYLKLLPITIKRSTLQIHFGTLCRKVIGRHCNFHMLRHSFGVNSVKQGVPLPFLQSALGHTRLDTTGIYTKASPEDMIQAYSKAWGDI